MTTAAPAVPPRAPGPRGVPLLGSLFELRRDPLSLMTRMAREYGDVVRLRVGLADAYLVSHPDYVKEVLAAFHRQRIGAYGQTMVHYAQRRCEDRGSPASHHAAAATQRQDDRGAPCPGPGTVRGHRRSRLERALKIGPGLAVAAMVACAWSCSRGESPPSSPARPPQVRSDASGSAPADPVALADRYVADADRLAREARYADARASFARAAEIYRAGRQWRRYVHCLNGMGEQSRRLARLDEATGSIDEGLKAGLEHLGERNLEVASTYARRADIQYDRGNYEQAIRGHTQSLQLSIALLDGKHAEVAASYAGRGNARRNKGEFKEALADCNQALAIQLAALGERHPDVAWTYNILGTIFSEKGDYADAFAAYSKALAILRGATGHDAVRLAKVLSNLGSHYDDRGDYDKALASYHEALSLQTAILGEQHPQVAGTCNNIGVVYDVKADYGQALAFYERAVAIYLATGRGQHPHIAHTYGNMGLVYFARKDYAHAIMFMNKARSVFSSTLGESHPVTAAPYNNLGNVYKEMGDYDQAIACHEKALAIEIRSQGTDNSNVASSYNNLGSVYAAKGDYDRAVALHEKALAIALRALGPRHPDVANIYRNLGSLYDRRGNAALSVANHRKALAIYRSNFADHHPEVAQSSNDLADVYRRHGPRREALALFEQAIRANRAPPPEGSAGVTAGGGDALSETVLLESLSGKARVLADEGAVRAGRDLRAAVSTYEDASSLLDRIRRGYRAEGSKLLLAERAAGLYDRAIAAALELYRETGEPRHLEAAFRFAEKSRSGILLDALSKAEAERFAGIPETLLSQERALRMDLAFYERARSEEEHRGKEADTAKLALWQDKVFGLKRAYDGLLERLERDYPDYYKLKYNAGTPSLADVQKGIPDDRTALVEYFTGADQVFIFVVSKQGSVVKAATKGPLFEQQVQELRQGIVDRDFSRYVGAARRLYEVVLAPIDAEVTGKSLIIVPDGSLSTVPFEALLTRAVPEQGSGGYSGLPYVLEEHDVAYAYSATLLLQKLRARGRRAPRDFVGFAPVFAEGPPAGTPGASRPLPATREEVTSILEHVQGSHGLLERWLSPRSRVYLGREAREESVKSDALADYRFVHFATHGLLNEKDPELSGLVLARDDTSKEDGVLRLGEVYNLRLAADLVVLSACETGLGQVARGEGTIGLTRGFLYAGAASVMVSLWQVSDATTSDLMVDFYDAMLRETDKPRALREAKRRLIRRQPEYAKPYYWAPFILIGR